MKQHLVYVGIGSNIEQEKHIRLSAQSLRAAFGEHCQLQLSPVYRSQSVGFEGDDFYNLVACFYTELSAFDVENQLKAIEHQYGRRRNQDKFSPRTLDIDLLLYDQEIIQQDGLSIPRDEIEKYAFVLLPLSELAPELIHPQTKRRIMDMWSSLEQTMKEQSLEKIHFEW